MSTAGLSFPPAPASSISRYWVFPVVFAEYFSLGMLRPELPQLLLSWFSGDLASAALFQGFTEALGAILAFVGSPLLGKLSDQYGRTKPMILTGSLSCMPLMVILIFSVVFPSSGVSILPFYALAAAGSKMNCYSLALSYVADCSTKEQRSAAFGEVSAVIFLSLTAGPFLSSNFSRDSSLMAAAAISFTSLMYITFILPETRKNTGNSSVVSSTPTTGKISLFPSIFPAIQFFTSNSLYSLIAMITFVSQFIVFGIGQIYFLYLTEEIGFSRADNIFTAIISGLETCIIMLGLLPWISHHFYSSTILLFSGTSYFIYILSLIFCISTKIQVYFLIIFWAISGMFYPTLCSGLSQIVPDESLGLSQGSIAAVRSLASGLGPAIFGYILSSSVKAKHAALGEIAGQSILFPEDSAAIGSGFFTIRYITFPFLLGSLLMCFTLLAVLYLPSKAMKKKKKQTPNTINAIVSSALDNVGGRKALGQSDSEEDDSEDETTGISSSFYLPFHRFPPLSPSSESCFSFPWFTGNHHIHHDGHFHQDSHIQDSNEITGRKSLSNTEEKRKVLSETDPLLGKSSTSSSSSSSAASAVVEGSNFQWRPRSSRSRWTAILVILLSTVVTLWGIRQIERFEENSLMKVENRPTAAASILAGLKEKNGISMGSAASSALSSLPSIPFSLIALVGEGGVGKTSYATLLGPALNFGHLSTGVLLRKEIADNTTLGQQVMKIVQSGHLVEDSLVFELVKKEISRLRSSGYSGVMLDGFPRSLSQAYLMPDEKENIPGISAVVYFFMREEYLIQRISGRRVCPKCGASYNLAKIENSTFHYSLPSNSPISLNPLVCDHDQTPLESREDDRPEIVHQRHQVFIKETMPLIDYYSSQRVEIPWEVKDDPRMVLPQLIEEIYKKIQQYHHRE